MMKSTGHVYSNDATYKTKIKKPSIKSRSRVTSLSYYVQL